MVLGVPFCVFLWNNSAPIAMIVGELIFTKTVVFFESYIEWLMGWPAGLKLNSNLNKFLGELYLWLISIWSVAFFQGIIAMEYIVKAVSVSGLFGVSYSIAIVIDLLRVATVHVRLFYFLSTRLYGWQVRIICSLFHLFRGKKWNVLKDRLDSAEYDLDQLLLGTILFSALVFLFPTVAVYYVLFLFSATSWIILEVALMTVGVMLKRFPLFEVALRLYSPDTLMYGVQINLSNNEFVLRAQPKPIMALIKPLLGELANCWTSFVNIANIKRMFKGLPIVINWPS